MRNSTQWRKVKRRVRLTIEWTCIALVHMDELGCTVEYHVVPVRFFVQRSPLWRLYRPNAWWYCATPSSETEELIASQCAGSPNFVASAISTRANWRWKPVALAYQRSDIELIILHDMRLVLFQCGSRSSRRCLDTAASLFLRNESVYETRFTRTNLLPPMSAHQCLWTRKPITLYLTGCGAGGSSTQVLTPCNPYNRSLFPGD